MFRTKVVEKIKTHILCSIIFFPENHDFNEIMCENIAQPHRHICFACWIPKATNTNSEYVIVIALPRP